MKNKIVTFSIAAIIIAGLSFYGGIKYQQSQGIRNFRQFAGGGQGFEGQMRIRNGSGLGPNGGSGGRQVAGEILNQDGTSITVKMPDGSSRIVLLTDKTTYNKASEGTKSDLKVGEQVRAFGTDNADGSITAVNIQLNPVFRVASEAGITK